jgi:hypothetical protein
MQMDSCTPMSTGSGLRSSRQVSRLAQPQSESSKCLSAGPPQRGRTTACWCCLSCSPPCSRSVSPYPLLSLVLGVVYAKGKRTLLLVPNHADDFTMTSSGQPQEKALRIHTASLKQIVDAPHLNLYRSTSATASSSAFCKRTARIGHSRFRTPSSSRYV